MKCLSMSDVNKYRMIAPINKVIPNSKTTVMSVVLVPMIRYCLTMPFCQAMRQNSTRANDGLKRLKTPTTRARGRSHICKVSKQIGRAHV